MATSVVISVAGYWSIGIIFSWLGADVKTMPLIGEYMRTWYGGGVAVVFFLCAPVFASVFSDDPKVAKFLIAYIRIISFGYGMMEVHRYCGFVLTGLHKPVFSTVLNAIRVLGLLIPLSYLGASLGGVRGVFLGRLATDIIVGSIGLAWVYHSCDSLRTSTVIS